MFVWKYFFLYFGSGFILGFLSISSNDSDNANVISGLLTIFIIGLLIWNFLTFGIGWGIISGVEVFAGIIAAVIMKGEATTE